MPAQTRGFLFSDLRGYSAFTERRGDRAARELLARYRSTVRAAIARFGGAEIRTEGDSFYVVFDSVSQAVEAGLAIQVALAENEGEPIHAGIGIHAGEVEDDAEQGIVSNAVNIAARICAVAEPGDVLVSDTVHALTRGYLTATFVPRGRRRLKGISHAVAVYAVLPAGASAASHQRLGVLRGRPLAFAISLLAILMVASVLVATTIREGLGMSRHPPASNGASVATHSSSTAAASDDSPPGVTTIDLGGRDETFGYRPPVELTSGTYAFDDFQPAVTFAVDGGGWYAYVDDVDAAGLLLDDPSSPPGLDPIGGVMFGAVQVVYNDPCDLTDTTVLEGTPKAFIEWLQGNEALTVSNARPMSLAGYSGLGVDVSLAGTACRGATRLDLFPVAENRFGLHAGDRLRVITLNVGSAPVSVLVQHSSEAGAEVEAELQRLVDSLVIDQP